MRTSFVFLALLLLITSCAGRTGDDATPAEGDRSEVDQSEGLAGVRLVSVQEADRIRLDPPDGLVVLDVRTPEEFADGHIEGAVMIDYYESDFADRLSALDPEQPYLLYCRSGNRSGQTAVLMEQLGFTDVADVDGGIIAWSEAGLPLVR